MQVYRYLVWDDTEKKERVLEMKYPLDWYGGRKEGDYYILGKDKRGGAIRVKVIREAAPEDVSGAAAVRALQNCIAGNCTDCRFHSEPELSPNGDCKQSLMRNALDYIIRLEEHDERRKPNET